MLRILLAVAIYALLPTADADACSCVKRTFAEHAKQASRVFLGQAGKPIKTGDRLQQEWMILANFKGDHEKFVHDRRATPPCASSYKYEEYAILFTTSGDLDPCHGNVPLEAQISELKAILDATGTKYTDAKLETVEVALRKVLPKYLHVPQVSVRLASLDGKSIQIDKSRLTFAKAASPKDIEITTAIATERIAYVEGRYASEGLRFKVLLYNGRTWHVLQSWATEK
jgi:hypothetical protein